MSLNLVIAQCLLLMLGLLGIATSAPDMIPDHAGKILISVIVTLLLSRLRPKAFMQMAPYFWGLCLALLVLVIFIGKGGNGSDVKRWLSFGGPFTFQPSELAKLALTMQLASFFARRGVQRKLISATGMIVLTTALVLVQPDLGTTVLIFALGIVLMYAAGVKFTSISGLLFAIGLVALPFVSGYLERHQYILARIRGHSADKAGTVVGSTQLDLAHRDLGWGGFWGAGPDGPRHPYSADHTDMVIASVGFSTGLLGVIMAIFAYWLVVASALQVAEWAGRIRPLTPEVHGASILATGAMFMVVGQAFVNLAVAAGFFPVTGVPLPLVSYGFSSMLSMSVAFALIHSALREVRRHLPDNQREPVPAPAD